MCRLMPTSRNPSQTVGQSGGSAEGHWSVSDVQMIKLRAELPSGSSLNDQLHPGFVPPEFLQVQIMDFITKLMKHPSLFLKGAWKLSHYRLLKP